MLIGIDFLTADKCMINFDTNTVYSKLGPNKMVFGCLDRVCRITVAETVTSPNMVADIPYEVQGVDDLDDCMYGCTGTSGQVFRKIFCWGLLDGSDSQRRSNPS